MKEAIRQKAIDLGFDLCRFTSAEPPGTGGRFLEWVAGSRHGELAYMARNTHKRLDLEHVLPGARSVVCVAASYWHEPDGGTADGTPGACGVVARYARHLDYHAVMGEQLRALCSHLLSVAGPDHRALWYVDTGPVLERDLAERAGVGFIGKHTNLISRRLGNWLLLGEILTSVPLDPDEPERNRCGSCTRCITACPTEAIRAPYQLDARRCISYLTIELKGSIPPELRPAVGNRVFGCDDCLEACPWNRFAQQGRMLREHRIPGLDQPDLEELLALDPAAFRDRFAGTPILRARRDGLLRNVCVALGNVGRTGAIPALERAAARESALVAEHARWAVRRIEDRHGIAPA